MSELQSDSSLDTNLMILFGYVVWSLVHLNVCWSNRLCLSHLSGMSPGERLCLVLPEPACLTPTPTQIHSRLSLLKAGSSGQVFRSLGYLAMTAHIWVIRNGIPVYIHIQLMRCLLESMGVRRCSQSDKMLILLPCFSSYLWLYVGLSQVLWTSLFFSSYLRYPWSRPTRDAGRSGGAAGCCWAVPECLHECARLFEHHPLRDIVAAEATAGKYGNIKVKNFCKRFLN